MGRSRCPWRRSARSPGTASSATSTPTARATRSSRSWWSRRCPSATSRRGGARAGLLDCPPVRRRRVTVDLSILRENPQFRLLLGGEVLSAVGSQAALVAIPYQVYVLTLSPALVGLLGIAELGPLIAGSLLGGVAADRHDRRRVLRRAQIGVA